MNLSVTCPGCQALYPAEGVIDLGNLPSESMWAQGVTEASLGLDCPGCRTHVDLKFTAAWRAPT